MSKPRLHLFPLSLSCVFACQNNVTEPVGTWTDHGHSPPVLIEHDASARAHAMESAESLDVATASAFTKDTSLTDVAIPPNTTTETDTTETETEPSVSFTLPYPTTTHADLSSDDSPVGAEDAATVRDVDAGIAAEPGGPFIQSDHRCSDRWAPVAPVVPPQGCARLEWIDADVEVQGMSADGSTFIGRARPFEPTEQPSNRWFIKVHGQPIEYLDEGLRINDVSDDGAWFVGARIGDTATSLPMILGGDRQPLFLSPIIGRGEAASVSGDGCVIVGNGAQTSDEPGIGTPFYWTPQAGLVWLPSYPVGSLGRIWSPIDVSGDGNVVLGILGPFAPQSSPSAVIWTPDSGLEFVSLGRPFALSHDGMTAVGDSGNPVYASESRLWRLANDERPDSGAAESAPLEEPSHTASVVNANATVVFSEARPPGRDTTTQPHVWRQGIGTETLLSFLEGSCIDTTVMPTVRWRVTATSADATIVVGCAEVDNTGRCWVASWN